jgi:adenosine deaminase CECR1
MESLGPHTPIMAPRTLKTALLLATCCASAASCASSRASGAPQDVPDVASYREARERLVRQERARRLSAALVLSADEEAAGLRLAELRKAEEERLGADLPPAHSFLLDKTKRLVEASPLLEVMRRLPKGGILHVHGAAGGDLHWLVSHATYRPDCHMYLGDGGETVRGTLRFFPQPPGGDWRPVVALRSVAPDPRAFDEELYRSITLGEEDREAPDIWEEFRRCFRRAWRLFDDGETRAGHWRRMLESLIDENVQYVEFRGWPVDEAVVREARLRDPDFAVKFIPVAGRSSDQQGVHGALERALAERERDPGRVAGFDLVEEEDHTHGTLHFAEEILAARREAGRRGLTLPLFLHSGETSRAEGENLYDAVLLGARRIGHGLALVRHPLLMERVRERGIAIEACPISNQVLGYVGDLRAHPAVAYINAGIPVVLSPDDPGIMRHTFSHDFYEAFMAWELDLRDLKQLALDSLLHSAMGPEDKARARLVWEGRWAEFVRWLNGPGARPAGAP